MSIKFRRSISGLIVAAIMLSLLSIIPTVTAASLSITRSGGWYETAYVEWSGGSSSSYSVYYKKASEGSYTQADSQLIRGTRADIPGLAGNTAYNIKVVSGSEEVSASITTMAHNRDGYAHWNYSSGIGAYNNDGTLKSGVTVLYVTNSNKDSVTYNGQTGIYKILGKNTTANLAVRFIGDINPPSGTQANDGSSNDGSGMVYLNQLKNVTLEGIGYDTHFVRWGICLKKCESVEIRNLYFYQYPDDAVGIQGSNASEMAKRIWVHNNDFGIGKNEYAGNGTVDSDKAEGDGSCDIKWTEYVTVSYNHFDGCHKTSLVGGGPSQFQDWITYHHNWFEDCSSRSPRARNAHIHMFNNYFSDAGSYSVGASYNSKIFTECNYFQNCSSPLDMEAMGSDSYSGTIKSYGDVLSGCSGTNNAAKASSRSATVTCNNLKSGGEAYDNFDTNSSKIYSSYTVTSAEDGKTESIAYSGRMKNQDYNGGTIVNPPDPEDPDDPDEPDVPVTDTAVLNADDVSVGSYSADVKVNSYFSIVVNAADAVTVDAPSSSKTTSDGAYTISNRIKLGGAGSTDNRAIQINATAAGTLKVYMMSSNSTDARTANFTDSKGNVLSTATVGGSALDAFNFTIPSAGTYYIYSVSSGLNVYYALLSQTSGGGSTVLLGDVNLDTLIDIRDVAMLAKRASGILTLSAEAELNGDLTGDGTIDIRDVAKLAKLAAGV